MRRQAMQQAEDSRHLAANGNKTDRRLPRRSTLQENQRAAPTAPCRKKIVRISSKKMRKPHREKRKTEHQLLLS